MARTEDRWIEYAVSDWLRQKRRSLDLTQRDIAAAIGVSDVTVHLWETGARSPRNFAPWQARAKAVFCRFEIILVDTDGERHSF